MIQTIFIASTTVIITNLIYSWLISKQTYKQAECQSLDVNININVTGMDEFIKYN